MNASGVTDRLVNQAKVCDQTRILARLAASGTGNCLPVTPNPKGAVAASVLERQAATSCQVSGPEALLFPRAGVSESVRIQRVQQAALACNVNPTNPATRFNAQVRFVPQAPCPPPTAEQLNSTAPKPTFKVGCPPSRFF